MFTAQLLLITTAVTFCSALRGLLPDIILYGTILKEGDDSILHLNCRTSHKTLDCSVEFHVNDVTYDSLRFFNDVCVHNADICRSNDCSCTENCMKFTLNMSTKSINSTFGCEGRIFVLDTKTIYSVRTAVKQNGEDFRLFEKVIIPVNVGETTASLTPKSKTNKLIYRTLIIVAGILLVISGCIGGICMLVFKTKRINKPFKKKKLEEEKGDRLSYIENVEACKKIEMRSTSKDRSTIRTRGETLEKRKIDHDRPYSAISIISGSSTEENILPTTRDELPNTRDELPNTRDESST